MFENQAQEGLVFLGQYQKKLDFMFGLEVTILDGHSLEPFYIDLSKIANQQQQSFKLIFL